MDKSRKKKCLTDKQIKELQGDKGVDGMTLQEIGDIFSVTRMRICQIEKGSLKKLAALSELEDLKK